MNKGLVGDRRGAIAILVALLALPLLGLIGLAVDYGSATMAEAKLDVAADAAALLATTSASNAYLAGAIDPIGTAEAAATARFNAQAANQPGVAISSLSVSVQQTGTVFVSNISYKGSITTTLGRIYGVLSIGVGGRASASLSLSPYIDLQVLMDVSSSMTIAATTSAIAQMNQLTQNDRPTGNLPGNVSPGEACAFACHWNAAGGDYYALAQQNNVLLRLDVLRSAVSNLIQNVTTLDTQQTMRLGLYTFNESFTQIFPLSGAVAGASSALAQIAPDVNDCSNNCPETYFSNAMQSMVSITGQSGSGATQATSEKYLFIVTDGLVDEYSGGSRVISTVDLSACNALKAKGVKILVLYTTYLPLPTNGFYQTYVAPIQANIGPQLEACATSPAFFFQANDAADIDTELQQMLATVIQASGHLTQ